MVRVLRVMIHSYDNEILEKALDSIRKTCNCEPKISKSKLIPNYAFVELPLVISPDSVSRLLKELGIEDFKLVVID